MDKFTNGGSSYKDIGNVLVQSFGNSDRMELPNSSKVAEIRAIAMEKTSDSKDLSTTSQGHHHHHHNHHHHHHHRVRKEKLKTKKLSTKQERFDKTASVLRQAGLMQMALKTAQIMEENAQLQRDIDALKEEAIQYAQTLQDIQQTPKS